MRKVTTATALKEIVHSRRKVHWWKYINYEHVLCFVADFLCAGLNTDL